MARKKSPANKSAARNSAANNTTASDPGPAPESTPESTNPHGLSQEEMDSHPVRGPGFYPWDENKE